MKKFSIAALGVLLPLLSYASVGETFEYGGIYYTVLDETAKTVKTADSEDFAVMYGDENLLIPSTVQFNNITYTVSEIGKKSFYDNQMIKSVTLPNTITYIGEEAFMWSQAIEAVTFGNSISKVGDAAFYNCTALTRVNVADIESWCNIEFEHYYSNPLYFGHNIYMDGTKVTELTIPEGVTTILPFAFINASCLTSVNLPNTIISIEDDAFTGCSGLTSFDLPASVTTLDNCFNGTSITRLNITDLEAWCKIEFLVNPLVTIGQLYLNGEELTDLTIPESITTVLPYAFQGCTSLKTITIPDWVTIIDYAGFDSCTNLETVDLGNSITKIGRYAFDECESLKEIRIPDSVTFIDEDAFRYCSALTTVTIGSAVEWIGEDAFQDCDAMTTLIVRAENPPTIDEDTFTNFNVLLIVPEGSIDKYKNDPIWGKFLNIESGVGIIPTDAADIESIYTIQGIRLSEGASKTLPAGVYVIDGKKVYVK